MVGPIGYVYCIFIIINILPYFSAAIVRSEFFKELRPDAVAESVSTWRKTNGSERRVGQ